MANGSILDALAPIPQATSFPYPTVFQQSGPGSPTVTYEGPTINGIPMPGQWLLKRSVREFGWQQQQANFMSGAYLVPKGDPLMDPVMTGELHAKAFELFDGAASEMGRSCQPMTVPPSPTRSGPGGKVEPPPPPAPQ